MAWKPPMSWENQRKSRTQNCGVVAPNYHVRMIHQDTPRRYYHECPQERHLVDQARYNDIKTCSIDHGKRGSAGGRKNPPPVLHTSTHWMYAHSEIPWSMTLFPSASASFLKYVTSAWVAFTTATICHNETAVTDRAKMWSKPRANFGQRVNLHPSRSTSGHKLQHVLCALCLQTRTRDPRIWRKKDWKRWKNGNDIQIWDQFHPYIINIYLDDLDSVYLNV